MTVPEYLPIRVTGELLQLRQRHGLLTRVAFAAVHGIGYDDGLLRPLLPGVQAHDEGRYGNVILADGSAAKATDGVRRAIAVDAVHRFRPFQKAG